MMRQEMIFQSQFLLHILFVLKIGYVLVGSNEITSKVGHTCSSSNNEGCDVAIQNDTKNVADIEKISELLHALVQLQTRSAKIEKAIRQQGREIKLDIFPELYDKRTAPPRINGTLPNEIMVTIDIFSIPHLDEKLEEIMIEVRVTHLWKDNRLLTSSLPVPVELEPNAISDLWTPDSYFHHTKESRFIKLMTPTASLTIYPNQTIRYSTMLMLTIGCPMKFHNYPMDQQTCRLQLQSFGYDIEYNTYHWLRKPHIHKDINLDNHEVNIKEYNFNYTSGEGLMFPGLGVQINLRRHIGFHLTLTYIPSIIFVLVAWLSFLVPSDIVPGRMVLCVTTLLTLTSMFNSVRTLTPQVSYMKAIDSWVFVCMLFVFSSLAEYGLILHLTSRSGWQKRVDQHIKSLTGNSRLSVLTPVKLISLTINKNQDSNLSSNEHEHLDIRCAEFKKNYDIFETPTKKSMADLRKDEIKQYKTNEDIICNVKIPSGRVNGLSTTPNTTDKDPTSKERWAYAIEFSAKILYPICFLIYNIIYWTSYYGINNYFM